MIGLRVGPATGLRPGVAAGMSADPLVRPTSGSMAGVAQDATSGVYWPANLTQWNLAIAAAGLAPGGPSLGYLAQEPSGNLADSIGTFTGVVTGAPVTYQQPVAGWSRLDVVGADAGTGAITNADAGLPDPATTSSWSLSYINVTGVVAATRFLQTHGTAQFTAAQLTIVSAANRLRCQSGANNGTGVVIHPTGQYLLECLYDVANNRAVVSTQLERLIMARGATSGKRYLLSPNFPGGIMCSAVFFGAAAERSDADRKALYQTLGWPIAY